MNNDISDEFVEFMSERFIEKFEGITLGDYDTIFESIKENDGNPAVPLIRYIILLTRCSEDNVDEIIALAKGKFVDEIVIPQNDTEIKDFQ